MDAELGIYFHRYCYSHAVKGMQFDLDEHIRRACLDTLTWGQTVANGLAFEVLAVSYLSK